jgi:hypothetical protein
MVSKKASTKKPEPWGQSEAKKHLSSLLKNDTYGIAVMAVEDVHKLSTLFQLYDIKRFAGYLTTLKNGIAKKKKAPTEKPPAWGKSEARKHLNVLLENDTDGIAGMAVEDVHKLSTLFQSYDIKRFTGYLTTLKNGIAKKKKAPTEKPPAWGKSEARKHLYALLENDTINGIAGMAVDDVHKLSPLFQPYDIKRFTGYLKALKSSIANANLPKPPPWKTSKAKETLKVLLESDADGEIHSMDAAAVQMLSSLFEDYSKTNFRTNLRNLKESIRTEKAAVKSDEEFLLRDKVIVESKEMYYPPWEKSEAKRFLRKDVQDKKHEHIKPKQLRETRPEYMMFTGKVFGKHIYQEELSQGQRSYWMHKKKLKQEAKKKAKEKQQQKYSASKK